ncbi:DNA repair endonuclease XPF-like protein [Perkinsela sp. CCAP 1560/4]|nr:DNA repair endonuclease XPF-like protein [Perkinsela sp. CCAP 1560/4]|eukprot:KNH09547.1 DNA repair endonuclease XPF-like protein [Perkinsela sp. CCAP 1560/4]
MHLFTSYIRATNKNAIVHCITATTTIRERCAMYKKRGLFICYSARPVLMDILHKRISVECIQGACVLNAHTLVSETFSIENFLLYMMHTRGNGYICATSESPGAFLGPGRLAYAMNSVLFCTDVQFYPRFHVSLKEILDNRQPDVVEVRIPLTKAMRHLQTVLFSILSELLRELTSQIDKMGYSELKLPSVESMLDGIFVRQIRHKIAHSKQNFSRGQKIYTLEKTISSLEDIIDALKRLYLLDPLSFSIFCERLLNTSKRDGIDVSPWLYTKQAHQLVPAAIEYQSEYLDKKESQKQFPSQAEALVTTKEQVIRKILTQAESENQNVLLLLKSWVVSETNDLSFCNMENIDSILHSAVYQTFQHFHDCSALCGILNELPLCIGWEIPKNASVGAESLKEQNENEENMSVDEKVQNLYLKSRKLDVQPDWIILCGLDLKSIRRIELLQALMYTYSTKRLKVYLLNYDGSIEQSVYLHEMKSERDSFTELVATKANLVFHDAEVTQDDGRGDADPNHDTNDLPKRTLSTLKKTPLSQNFTKVSTIIVDEREFRSSLPFQLMKKDTIIVPRTLFCGDYILSDDVIVERKSATDLESSVNDGRLLSQLYTMQRSYSVCILLIESGSTSLSEQKAEEDSVESSISGRRASSKGAVSKILRDSRIIEKLCVVSKCFPNVRFLWSNSDEESVALFMEIKRDRSEPEVPADLGVVMNKDPKKIRKEEAFVDALKEELVTHPDGTTADGSSLPPGERTSSDMFDELHDGSLSDSLVPYATQFLLHLPGVNHNNIGKLAGKYESLNAVASSSFECLKDTLGEFNATLLYNALHISFN